MKDNKHQINIKTPVLQSMLEAEQRIVHLEGPEGAQSFVFCWQIVRE